jgi:hypothetical protein
MRHLPLKLLTSITSNQEKLKMPMHSGLGNVLAVPSFQELILTLFSIPLIMEATSFYLFDAERMTIW